MNSQQEKELVEKINEKLKNNQPLTAEEETFLYSQIAKGLIKEVRNKQPLTPGEVAQNFYKQNKDNYPHGMARGHLAWAIANGDKEPSELTKDEMKHILFKAFGDQCWGCDFQAQQDDRSIQYLEMDHINPKVDGGPDRITNRALLCGPCNNKKSNKMTLSALRYENYGSRRKANDHPIDLKEVSLLARAVEEEIREDQERWKRLTMMAEYEERQESNTRRMIEQHETQEELLKKIKNEGDGYIRKTISPHRDDLDAPKNPPEMELRLGLQGGSPLPSKYHKAFSWLSGFGYIEGGPELYHLTSEGCARAEKE